MQVKKIFIVASFTTLSCLIIGLSVWALYLYRVSNGIIQLDVKSKEAAVCNENPTIQLKNEESESLRAKVSDLEVKLSSKKKTFSENGNELKDSAFSAAAEVNETNSHDPLNVSYQSKKLEEPVKEQGGVIIVPAKSQDELNISSILVQEEYAPALNVTTELTSSSDISSCETSIFESDDFLQQSEQSEDTGISNTDTLVGEAVPSDSIEPLTIPEQPIDSPDDLNAVSQFVADDVALNLIEKSGTSTDNQDILGFDSNATVKSLIFDLIESLELPEEPIGITVLDVIEISAVVSDSTSVNSTIPTSSDCPETLETDLHDTEIPNLIKDESHEVNGKVEVEKVLNDMLQRRQLARILLVQPEDRVTSEVDKVAVPLPVIEQYRNRNSQKVRKNATFLENELKSMERKKRMAAEVTLQEEQKFLEQTRQIECLMEENELQTVAPEKQSDVDGEKDCEERAYLQPDQFEFLNVNPSSPPADDDFVDLGKAQKVSLTLPSEISATKYLPTTDISNNNNISAQLKDEGNSPSMIEQKPCSFASDTTTPITIEIPSTTNVAEPFKSPSTVLEASSSPSISKSKLLRPKIARITNTTAPAVVIDPRFAKSILSEKARNLRFFRPLGK